MCNALVNRPLRIGIFAVSGAAEPESVKTGLNNLSHYGVEWVFPGYNSNPEKYLAASDNERAASFNALLDIENLDVLMALKGGYGSMRVLEQINWSKLQERQLPVIGYSDVTALQLASLKYGCYRNIHGPMVCSSFGKSRQSQEDACKMDAAFSSLMQCLDGNPCPLPRNVKFNVHKSGTAVGRIIPANLTMLVSLLGTPFFPELENCILAVEDINEPCYRIDRMLTQLRLAGVLSGISALVFGQFSLCEDVENLDYVFEHFAGYISGPVVSGLPFGHINPSISICSGAMMQIDTGSEIMLYSAY